MAFLLSNSPRLDAQPEPIRPANRSVLGHAGARSLHLEFDADADIAGWAAAESHIQPGVIVYGWPLAPSGDRSPTSPEKPGDHRLSAVEIARIIADSGIEAVERLRGSFVLVVGHAFADRIDCYRSRAGGRTAYWTTGRGQWTISDSVVEVSRSRATPMIEEPRWLARFFALSRQYPAGLTPFEGVRELMPGEHLRISGDRVRTRRTPLSLKLQHRPRKISDWVESFGARLENAVADCLPADRASAIMLSGGMDSGPAAVIASELARRRGAPLHAISWRIKEFPECDEWEWISRLAGHLGIGVTKIEAENHLPFASLSPDQVDSGSPFFNPFRPLVLACYANARDLGCGVMLNAASGDALYPQPARALLDDIAHADVRSAMRRLSTIVREHGLIRAYRAVELRAIASASLGRDRWRNVSNPGWLAEQAVPHLTRFERWPPECARSLHPAFGQQLFGPIASGGTANELFFSQRYGVDRRDPYLDIELRRLMLQMPHALIWRQGTNKWIARESMKGRMPESFRTKPRTGQLSAFFHHGFDRQRKRIREFLLDQQSLWSPWIRPDALNATLNGESSDERSRMVACSCIGYVLWKQRIDRA